MIRLRPYKESDARTVLSWCRSEKEFYQWTAGRLGTYPITEQEFQQVNAMMAFIAFDESGPVGFFTLRKPGETDDVLRFGFVILDPEKRGRGCGKAMLRLGFKFVFEIYQAKTASLGVFENNPSAYACYRTAGFRDNTSVPSEVYPLMGEDWKCLELIIEA